MITIQSILELLLVVIQLCVGILNMMNLIQSIIQKHTKKRKKRAS